MRGIGLGQLSHKILAVGLIVGLAMLIGCQSEETKTPTPTSVGVGATFKLPPTSPPGSGGLGGDSDLLLHQRELEGLYSGGPDLNNIDEVFWFIFSRLPDQVTVYPSENYFYFVFYAGGREMWGNIRLPAGRREHGVLSFAYFEFIELPSYPGTGVSSAKFYTDADGLKLEEIEFSKWRVTYNKRSVIFNLHKLRQDPPNLFPLGKDEVFVERTFDDGGMQFFLLFNERSNYFIWVLNEEERVPDFFNTINEDLVAGKLSGFAFWVDKAHGGRKVLLAVRRLSVIRNDHYDGPFDQLADNYVDQTHISEYMIKANPSLAGHIDKYGYYTDTDRPLRVALSEYGSYYTTSELQQLLARAKASEDPYQIISRGGVPLPEPPTPPPSPAP